jgi:hypothetical protein
MMGLVALSASGLHPKPGGQPPAGVHTWMQVPPLVPASQRPLRQRLIAPALALQLAPIRSLPATSPPSTSSGGTHTDTPSTD